MFSLEMLNNASDFMMISVICMIIGLTNKRFTNHFSDKIMKFAGIILLGISIFMLVWTVINKEQFHWNFDITTGEPVDHYSTYVNCIVYSVIAMIGNAILCVSYWFINKQKTTE